MADSHSDDLHLHTDVLEEFEKLEKLSKRMILDGSSKITAGGPYEQALFEHVEDGTLIRRLPNDPLALRVSIGEVNADTKERYLVFRGDTKKIRALLKTMVKEFDKHVRYKAGG